MSSGLDVFLLHDECGKFSMKVLVSNATLFLSGETQSCNNIMDSIESRKVFFLPANVFLYILVYAVTYSAS